MRKAPFADWITIYRYALVGLANTAVGFAIIAVLDPVLGINPALANAISYAIGICLSFFLSRNCVFRSNAKMTTTAQKFLVAAGLAFSLNQGVLYLAGRAFGEARLAHLAAQLLGMITYTGSNFVLCRCWVFSSPE